MTHDALVNRDWQNIVDRLGGAEALQASARSAGAFQRARVVANASDLLRLILTYCLGAGGLRSAVAWASAVGLADLSNVALLYRLRQCGDWLSLLIGRVLDAAAPEASRGRLIRIVDATTLPQAGTAAKRRNQVWRIPRSGVFPGLAYSWCV